MKLAIIDIGSNSVRLMLWADGKTLYKKVKTTRLGEGLDASGVLSSVAMERSASAVAEFCEEARAAGARIYVFATAAVRAGDHGGEFRSIIKERCGVSLDVVSGEEEARLAVLGALEEEDGGIIDIGGASTEICIRKGNKTVFSRSLNIGAVRLHDSCGEDEDKLHARIRHELEELDIRAEGNVYGVGGTASTLASLNLALSEYDSEKLQGLRLSCEWLEETVSRLFSLSVNERRTLPGMDPMRADIIAGASLLLLEIMKKLSLPEIFFSDRDNLEGYIALRGLA